MLHCIRFPRINLLNVIGTKDSSNFTKTIFESRSGYHRTQKAGNASMALVPRVSGFESCLEIGHLSSFVVAGGFIFNVRKISVSCDSFDAAAEIVTTIRRISTCAHHLRSSAAILYRLPRRQFRRGKNLYIYILTLVKVYILFFT